METGKDTARVGVHVRGIVQGVGMRPFAFGLAERLGLGGSVENRTDGVWLELEGAPEHIARFVDVLRREPPPLARVDSIETSTLVPRNERDFRIETSVDDSATPAITPDAATCADCMHEVLDPGDRRFGHPFASCASCGPRLTIVTGAPYDRAKTTMAAFPRCARCHAEYNDPKDRRFHAQPIACNECGPRLSASIASIGSVLRAGGIVAVKGIGGYHLACNATSAAAIAELRRRKHRDDKPFALMMRAEDLPALTAVERELLGEPARPIVLVRGAHAAAPNIGRIGVMLPYTPLHRLLLDAVGGPLVMTSGNVADEPIAYEDAAAIAGIADAVLEHDRAIHTRCDDSIAHVIDGAPALLRRSRGHAPASVSLGSALAKPTLATGGHLKATFALGRGREAVLSHHLGDLHHFEAWRAYRASLAHYTELFRLEPERIVHDLHPDYTTTAFAEETGRERIAVQHHEAHAAGVLVEHGLGEAICVVFDGAGFGTDGAMWGGEFFVGRAGALRRVMHLRYVRLPGGDRAARSPARVAEAYVKESSHGRLTSSVGRLFDAVAALAGIRQSCTFEAQAAMELQALAEGVGPEAPYPFDDLDPRRIIDAVQSDVRHGVGRAVIARRFHEGLAAAVALVCARIDAARDVALTGGVFANALLAELAAERLRARGFRPHFARRVPGNDGGLAFGQLAHVAARDGVV